MLRLLAALPVASAVLLSQDPAAAAANTVKYDVENYVFAWHRKCGCTASNSEGFSLMLEVIKILGEHRVRTNRCLEDCKWDWNRQRLLDVIAVENDEDLVRQPPTWPTNPPARVILVVDSDADVCKVPGDWLSSGKGFLRVSRSQFGTSKISGEHVYSCNQNFDAVWVPSWHDKTAFRNSGVAEEKVAVLHQSQDLRNYECQLGEASETGVAELDEFLAVPGTSTFLSVFTWEDRKNPVTLIETFAKTFPTGSTTSGKVVRLIAQVNTASDSGGFADYMTKMPDFVRDAIGNGQILINTRTVPKSKMAGLYRAVDAFVLATHGEGWGFSLAEAMASGLPVVATGWGGQTEFMDKDNSFLVDYKMGKASSDDKMGKASSDGDEWAVPDVDSLRQAMLDVVQKPAEAKTKGQNACMKATDVTKPAAVAWHIHELIMELQVKYQQEGSVSVQRARG